MLVLFPDGGDIKRSQAKETSRYGRAAAVEKSPVKKMDGKEQQKVKFFPQRTDPDPVQYYKRFV